MTTVMSCRMIDALMYSMMPSAAIENCSSAPPDSRLTKPSTESRICSKNSASALPSMPGVGMTTTARYTASMPNVNSSRRRSSGMRPAFVNPSSTVDHLGTAAGGGDAFLCGRAEGVRFDGQRLAQRALPEHLDRPAGAHQAARYQGRRVDHVARREHRLEAGEIDDPVGAPEGVVEAAFRQAALQRHLPAFEARMRVAAGARAAPLVTAPRGLAEPGARPAADTL